jgi:hypothetical protein
MLPFFEKQDRTLPNLYSAAWIFPFYLQVPYGPEETFFHQAESSGVEGPSQAVLGPSDERKVPASLDWDLSNQGKVPASLSLSLQSEKILALLYVGKGHLSTGHSVI